MANQCLPEHGQTNWVDNPGARAWMLFYRATKQVKSKCNEDQIKQHSSASTETSAFNRDICILTSTQHVPYHTVKIGVVYPKYLSGMLGSFFYTMYIAKHINIGTRMRPLNGHLNMAFNRDIWFIVDSEQWVSLIIDTVKEFMTNDAFNWAD